MGCQPIVFLLHLRSSVRKLRIIILIIVGLAVLIGLILFLLGNVRQKNAGLLIESVPSAAVYISQEQVGRTPYEATLKPGEVVVKIVPDASDKALAPYETKVFLVSGIKTVIRREFGETEETSAGETISFEKTGGKEINISVVTIPNSAQISIDGQIRGFAPYITSTLTDGEHSLLISSQGYVDRTISVRVVLGYKLTAVVKLKPTETPAVNSEIPSEKPVPEKKIMVEILTTPTGFLRVRKSASTVAEEVFQVKPGEKYPFLEEDSQNNWFKIEYQTAQAGQAAKEGWVTGQYAKKVEVEAGSSLTPTPTKAATSSATPTKKNTPTVTPVDEN